MKRLRVQIAIQYVLGIQLFYSIAMCKSPYTGMWKCMGMMSPVY